MSNFKKMLAAVISVVVFIGAAVCIGAVGSDELTITAKNVGASEIEIKLSNVCEYYLGNVNIKVSPVSGSGAKVSSYGIGGKSGADSVRSVAPGGSVSLTAKVSSANNGNTQQTKPPAGTTATTKKPVKNTSKTPTQAVPGVNDPTPIVTDNVEVTVGTVVSGEEGVITGDESASDTDTSSGNETSVGSVHSIAPGETATVVADMKDDEQTLNEVKNETDSNDGDDDGDGSSAVIWIVVGVIVVLAAAGVTAFFVIKKKKNITKDISAVIVLAVLLSALVSANGDAMTVSAADDIKTPTAGSVSTTIELSDGRGSILVTAEYTIAPKAVAQALKSARRAPATDECNNQNTPASRIVEGAGPLTGFNVYIGKNDFMFFGDAINDYKGQTIMNTTRLNKLSTMMNQRDSWAKENGIKLYLVIAPNKTSVYPDYVPSKVSAASKTNADVVVEYLAQNSTVEVIDLRGTLKSARSTYGDALFYKYDTHWNQNGGFVAYTEIMRRINEDVSGAYTLQKNDFDVKDFETYMKDMAWYLGHYSSYTDYGPVYTLRSGMTATLTNKGEYDWHGQFKYCTRWADGYSDSLKYVAYENKFNTDAPSVYMYRDSFSVSMLHFFKDSFHKSAFDWSYEFNKSEILQSGADVVIMEVVEKQLTEFTNTRTFTN